MNYTYIILSTEQESTLSNWLSNITEENFGDLWNTQFEKEFCAFVNCKGDKLFKVRKDHVNFLLAVSNSRKGGDHIYDMDLDIVHSVCGEPYHRSLQNFIDWIL